MVSDELEEALMTLGCSEYTSAFDTSLDVNRTSQYALTATVNASASPAKARPRRTWTPRWTNVTHATSSMAMIRASIWGAPFPPPISNVTNPNRAGHASPRRPTPTSVTSRSTGRSTYGRNGPVNGRPYPNVYGASM